MTVKLEISILNYNFMKISDLQCDNIVKLKYQFFYSTNIFYTKKQDHEVISLNHPSKSANKMEVL